MVSVQFSRFVRAFDAALCVCRFRITATLSCPMKLHKYPLDTQGCPVSFSSCKSVLVFRCRLKLVFSLEFLKS